MQKVLIAAGAALLLAGCGIGVTRNFNPNAPSPLYGGASCPGSAESASGAAPTPYDCIPGGREGSNNGGGGRLNR